MNPRRVALIAVVLSGCASSPARPRAPRYCPEAVSRPGTLESTVRVQATTSSAGAADSDREETERARDEEPPCVPRPRPAQDAISGLEAQIAQGLAAFAAPEPACRDACRAADGVCAAAREICRLTGDSDADHPIDLRCARAREACADAGRQRDARCPNCPTS